MEQNHLRIFRELPSSHRPEVNPYFTKLKVSCKDQSLPLFYGPYLKGKKGTWHKEFANKPQELLLEIGCHKGKTLSQFAEDHPDKAFIGMDITYKRVCETASLAKEKGLENIRSVLANANEMEHIFEEGELSGVVIFFPDPWLKKKKQQKNRLIKEGFCAILRKLLKKDGFIWFKTDSEEYFLEAVEALKSIGFQKADLCSSFFKKNYESTFETRFKSKGCAANESFFVLSETAKINPEEGKLKLL